MLQLNRSYLDDGYTFGNGLKLFFLQPSTLASVSFNLADYLHENQAQAAAVLLDLINSSSPQPADASVVRMDFHYNRDGLLVWLQSASYSVASPSSNMTENLI